MSDSIPDRPVRQISILVADDDYDDRSLFEDAAEESSHLIKRIEFAVDGVDLLDRLKYRGSYAEMTDIPLPDIVMLDLNMPRMDGKEVLKEMEKDISLKSIPVVIMSTSSCESDISDTYENGARSYITKPLTFEELVEKVREIAVYWTKVVRTKQH